MKPQSFELSRKTEINYYSHAFVIHNPLIFLADFTAPKKERERAYGMETTFIARGSITFLSI